MPSRQHWLVKSEPNVYSYEQLEKEGRTSWTGIRNFEARNNLRRMQPGDRLLYYHTGEDKEIVGVAEVLSVPGPDATAPGEDWSAVDVAPVARLQTAVPLTQLKKEKALRELPLLKKPRLSVVPVSPEEFACVLELARTTLPGRIKPPRRPAGR